MASIADGYTHLLPYAMKLLIGLSFRFLHWEINLFVCLFCKFLQFDLFFYHRTGKGINSFQRYIVDAWLV